MSAPTTGGNQANAPAPAPPDPAPAQISAFFTSYAPDFQYNPTAPSRSEFLRLCNESGWGEEHPERRDANRRFKDALVLQFNELYGTDVNSLENWQNLCYVVRIDPVPDDIRACRRAVRDKFVNLVDLVDTHNTGVEVRLFDTERELSEYTIGTKKFFPKHRAKAGGVLKFLLRCIFRPGPRRRRR